MEDRNFPLGCAFEEDAAAPGCAWAGVPGGLGPDTTTPQMLLHMIGRYMICELLIALNTFYIREGILLQVTQNFFLLYDESSGSRAACDLHALRFLTVFPPGVRPGPMSPDEKCAYLQRLQAEQNCRMQALPAPGGLPMTPFLPDAGNTPAMQYFGVYN